MSTRPRRDDADVLEFDITLADIAIERATLAEQKATFETELFDVKASYRSEHRRIWDACGEGDAGRREWLQVRRAIKTQEEQLKRAITSNMASALSLKRRRLGIENAKRGAQLAELQTEEGKDRT